VRGGFEIVDLAWSNGRLTEWQSVPRCGPCRVRYGAPPWSAPRRRRSDALNANFVKAARQGRLQRQRCSADGYWVVMQLTDVLPTMIAAPNGA